MTEDRIREIAKEFYMFLADDNDRIANDPSRWNEELTSWSMDDLGNVVAALISKAVNETRAEGVPSGYRLAPITHTIKMRRIFNDVIEDCSDFGEAYRQMLAAAPSPGGTKDEE